MADLAAAILAQRQSAATYRVGIVRTVSPLVVAVDGVDTPAIRALSGALGVDEQVLVETIEGNSWVTHCLEPRPQQGVVQAVSGGLASVDAGGRTYASVPVIAGTATLGATVSLLWGSVGVQAIAGGSTASPSSPPSPTGTGISPAPTPGSMDADRWESALIDARPVTVTTSRAGSWRTDGNAAYRAYQGHYPGGVSDDNTGWFFYGTALQAAGEATGCTVRLVRPRQVGNAGDVDFQVRLHASATKPGSPPAVLAGSPAVASLAWGETLTLSLGAAIGQQLLDGTAKGLALVYSGTAEYGALLGPTEQALAGQLVIPYRRKVT